MPSVIPQFDRSALDNEGGIAGKRSGRCGVPLHVLLDGLPHGRGRLEVPSGDKEALHAVGDEGTSGRVRGVMRIAHRNEADLEGRKRAIVKRSA